MLFLTTSWERMRSMSFIYQIFKKWYFKYFNYISEFRRNQNDLDLRDIHIFLSIAFSSGFIMWGYSFISLFTMYSIVPSIIGFVCSFFHILTPLLFRLTRQPCIPVGILLSLITFHEISFSHFMGGFYFNKLYWLGMNPLIAGLMTGKKGIIRWGIISLIIASGCLVLQKSGYHSDKQISENGIFLSEAMLVIGLLLMTSTIIWVYEELRKQTEIFLQIQNKKIDDLFRVLFHDLANPIGRISIGLTIAKRDLPKDTLIRGIEIAKDAADSMMQITHNVRKMYHLSKGNGDIDLTYTPLRDSLDYIQRVFSSELEKKKINILYSIEDIKSLQLLVEPISFNNQVLGNIISNAIKFSPQKGTIYISTTLLPIGVFKIEIKDQGIGIPSELLSHLFDINKKTSRLGTNGEQGTGFGLHIVKSFIEIYGGNIEVESFEASTVNPSSTCIKLFLKGKYE